jgi:hypothetical protein
MAFCWLLFGLTNVDSKLGRQINYDTALPGAALRAQSESRPSDIEPAHLWLCEELR